MTTIHRTGIFASGIHLPYITLTRASPGVFVSCYRNPQINVSVLLVNEIFVSMDIICMDFNGVMNASVCVCIYCISSNKCRVIINTGLGYMQMA